MSKGIFVTGTGTDVGKTYCTALLVKELREQGIDAGYFKAALSGAEELLGKLIPGDAQYVCERAGITQPSEELVAYCYKHAVSPHLAAQWADDLVEFERVEACFTRLQSRYEYLVAEGSGGLFCPLRVGEHTILLTDIIRRTGFKLLLVCPAGLGSINGCVLTAQYARSQGLEIAGVLMNGFEQGNAMHGDNKKQIEHFAGLPVLGMVEQDGDAIHWF